jgi:hypothetical protein
MQNIQFETTTAGSATLTLRICEFQKQAQILSQRTLD